MAEMFVRTIEREYARVSCCYDAATVSAALPRWFHHDKTVHPNRALGYRSPCEFIAALKPGDRVRHLGGRFSERIISC
jgi:putative transposase